LQDPAREKEVIFKMSANALHFRSCSEIERFPTSYKLTPTLCYYYIIELIFKSFGLFTILKWYIIVKIPLNILAYFKQLMKKSKPKEEFKTWGDVFDQFTQRTVYKLITQGHFRGLESPISIGKESNV